ncbi:MAG: hypothetical protein MJZ87_11935 [Bacteroidales bacterium]|nr:hypothetical protein [Bacteroidales bacterium]
MEKLLLTLILSGILFASFAQNDANNSGQAAQQEVQMNNVNPQCQLGDLAEHKVTIKQILEQPFLKVVPNLDDPFKMEISSFRVIIVMHGMEEPTRSCEGNQLNEKVKERISKLPAGSLVIFEDIKATSKACTRFLDEVTYRIVE